MDRFIVYVSIGLIVASVNMINAGKSCKDDKDKDKSKGEKPLTIGDIEISFGGDNSSKGVKCKEPWKSVFKSRPWCNFDDSDSPGNIVFFNGMLGDKVIFAYVCTEDVYNKQDNALKTGSMLKKLGDTSYYISVLLQDTSPQGWGISMIGDDAENVKVETVDGSKGKFKITLVPGA